MSLNATQKAPVSHTFMLIHPSFHPSMYWCDVVAKPLSLATVSLQARCGKQLQRLPLSTRQQEGRRFKSPGDPQGPFCVEFACSPRACVGSLHVPFHPPHPKTCVWVKGEKATSGLKGNQHPFTTHQHTRTITATLLGPPQLQLGSHCLITCALMSGGGITAEL